MLANCFLMKKDYANALTAFSDLDKLYPDVLDYRYSLAYIYDETGDHQKAEEIIDKLLAQYPDHAYVLNSKGFNLYYQGRYEEAVPFYEKAIRINPSWAYPWNNLGFVKYKSGHTEEALILIDKSLDLDKGNSFAYKYKGIIFLEQGDKTLAMEQFQLALKYRYTETYGEEVLQLIPKCR
jgi:tetratricopeptide (TPR) repeat protein